MRRADRGLYAGRKVNFGFKVTPPKSGHTGGPKRNHRRWLPNVQTKTVRECTKQPHRHLRPACSHSARTRTCIHTETNPCKTRACACRMHAHISDTTLSRTPSITKAQMLSHTLTHTSIRTDARCAHRNRCIHVHFASMFEHNVKHCTYSRVHAPTIRSS